MTSRTGSRLIAFGALFATSGSLAAVLLRSAEPERAQAGASGSLAALTDEAVAVERELDRLRPGRSARSALSAVRTAVSATEALRDDAAATADDLAINAIERELEYLDALGSVLSNPRSTLRPELAERGRRARAALAAAPGGQDAAAATSGWDDLLKFAERRRRRS